MPSALGTPPLALSRAAGLDLGLYRAEHVAERVRRALELEGLGGVEALDERLLADPAPRARFRRSVAVSVSKPFRDPDQFVLLREALVPPLLEGAGPIRVWSAGCADGAEPRSVAHVLDRLGALERAEILGSDVLEENLAAARSADAGAIAYERRTLPTDGPPPGRFDLVLCRNLAIYLAPAAKAELHELLAAALRPGGALLLGRSERLSDPTALGLVRVAPHAYRRTR